MHRLHRFDHERPESLDDYEARFWIDDYVIHISKVGGGTIGHAYSGFWHYAVRHAGGPTIAEGSDYATGSEHTHQDAAIELFELEPWAEDY